MRAKTADELSAQSLVYLFRAARRITPRLSGYGQFDYTRDRFAGIEHRNALLGGVEYLLFNTAPHDLKLFGGVGYVNEQRLTGDDVSTGALDAGWAYKLKVSETAEFATGGSATWRRSPRACTASCRSRCRTRRAT